MKTALDLLAQDAARSTAVARLREKNAQEVATIQARYEASVWTNSRSFLPAYIQGARDDINTMSRTETLRRARYFQKNSNVVKKALHVLNVNVVGTGITPTPATENEEWNREALDWWNAWVPTADITGTASVYENQAIAFQAETVDGDHGLELTLNEFGRPAISMIEGHRIVSDGLRIREIEAAGFRAIDGVIINGFGRPVAYTVTDDLDAKKIAVIPASRFVLFYSKRRAGQYRGITAFDSAILDLHDLDDLQKYEMAAAKDAASKSTVIKSAAGSGTAEGGGIGRSLNPMPVVSAETRAEYYKNAITGETIHMFSGDEMEQYRSERPTAATTGFWDRLENKFVQGIGLSYAALCDYRGNWGGATLRAAVAGDNRLFTLHTGGQARRWQRVWDYTIGWAIDHGEIPPNPDSSCVRWHPPRRTTVDIGNESTATLNELKAGTKTYEGIYGEAGDDWRERLRQRAIEEKEISDLAEEFGLARELIASFAQERVTVTAQGADPTGATDGAEEETETEPAPAEKPSQPKPKAKKAKK